MSNLSEQARAIALIARRAFPTAKTVRLESSDQAECLTYASPFVVLADGTEHDAEDGPDGDSISDDLWNPCCDISWDEAGQGDCPGWTVLNNRGGWYEFDIDTVLGHVPAFNDSHLGLALIQFQTAVENIPAEPPIIMAEVDEVTYRATFTPQAWVRNEAIDVDPQGETTWVVSDIERAQKIVAEDPDGLDINDLLKSDWNAPKWVREWAGPFSIHVEAEGVPHILSMTAHCPRCGKAELAEMDWDSRWNSWTELEFGTDGREGDLFVGIHQGDSNHETLVHFCMACGQVIDMHSEDAEIESVWS